MAPRTGKEIKNSLLLKVLSELSLAGVLNLGVLLFLFQPEGADYAHYITGSTPGFGNLTKALPLD